MTLHPTAILHVLADTADALRWALLGLAAVVEGA